MGLEDWIVAPDRTIEFKGDRLVFQGMVPLKVFRRDKLRAVAAIIETAVDVRGGGWTPSVDILTEHNLAVMHTVAFPGVHFGASSSGKNAAISIGHNGRILIFMDMDPIPDGIIDAVPQAKAK